MSETTTEGSTMSRHPYNLSSDDPTALAGNEQHISAETGFDAGDRFETDEQVRAYFTADVQRGMFDDDAITDQALLDEWAEFVIERHIHYESESLTR